VAIHCNIRKERHIEVALDCFVVALYQLANIAEVLFNIIHNV